MDAAARLNSNGASACSVGEAGLVKAQARAHTEPIAMMPATHTNVTSRFFRFVPSCVERLSSAVCDLFLLKAIENNQSTLGSTGEACDAKRSEAGVKAWLLQCTCVWQYRVHSMASGAFGTRPSGVLPRMQLLNTENRKPPSLFQRLDRCGKFLIHNALDASAFGQLFTDVELDIFAVDLPEVLDVIARHRICRPEQAEANATSRI